MPDTPKSANPNRRLSAEEVETLVATQRPSLLPGLGRDRQWLWYSGDKPAEEDRQFLKDAGFSFTPRAHVIEDGRSAHWFHACGGYVKRRRSGSTRQQSGSSAENSPASAESGPTYDDLARLTQSYS